MPLAELAEIHKLPDDSEIYDMPDICKVHARISRNISCEHNPLFCHISLTSTDTQIHMVKHMSF